MSRANSDLDFYRALRQFDVTQKSTLEALSFARAWADLARRVLATQAAQLGDEVTLPPALAYPALLAYLHGGPAGLEERFARNLPAGWDAAAVRVLAPLAGWLAAGFALADPAGSSFQVWVGPAGAPGIQLYGRPGCPTPPPPLRMLERPPLEEWLDQDGNAPAALIAHYDLHGLAMLALSLRYMQGLSPFPVDCAMSFEWTGDISKLWKRAVPKTVADPAGYGVVALIDCSVHSRQPEHTLKAVAKLDAAPHCRLLIIDHHVDTTLLAPQLMRPQVGLVLTDVLSCGLSASWQKHELELRALGALGDKVPEAATAFSERTHPQLHAAAAEYNRRLIQFSPTPPAMKAAGLYPLQPLWEALAAGRAISPALAGELLGPLRDVERPPRPAYDRVGSLIVITDRLSAIGRTWYGQLETLMEAESLHYAMAVRVMDEKRANILLLTDWRAVHMPPVRCFVPEQFLPRCLGHPAAVWADLETDEALPFLSEVAERMNSFLGTPGSFEHARQLIQRNILEAPRADGPGRAPRTAQP
jgi:hypothetical protein